VHDGKAQSNTYRLDRDFNWRGVCIDPFMENMEGRTCKKFYVALGSTPGEADFSMGGPLSGITSISTNDNNNKSHAEKVRGFPKKKVPVRLPADVLTEAEVPAVIDYLSLDVEGAELDILKSFPFDNYCVRNISVETGYQAQSAMEIHSLLLGHGYSFHRHNEFDDLYTKTCFETCQKEENHRAHQVTYLTFGTEGPPYDSGLPLIQRSNTLAQHAHNLGCNSIVYTPRRIRDSKDYDPRLLTSWPSLCKGEHRRGCMHGFWAWKPFIIKDALEKLNDNDMLIYSDSNYEKYSYLLNGVSHIIQFAKRAKEQNISFWAAQDPNNHTIGELVKPSLLKGLDPSLPAYHANVIVCRKTPKTMAIVDSWLNKCLSDDILPDVTGNDEGTMWHTHDQAILSCIMHQTQVSNEFPFKFKQNIWTYSPL